MTDTATTNGKAAVDLHHTSGGPQVDLKPTREKATKSLLVKPSTHEIVAAAAKRLDRTMDACVKAGLLLLNAATAGQDAQDDDSWAKSIGGKS